ncbi:MAG: FxsA family protein [Thermodesulfobacteriota bacterium]
MFFKLFLLFTIIPVVELAILIKVGSYLGTLHTVLLVIGTALVGAWLVRLEGLNVAYRFQGNLASGVFPSEEIFDGALLLVAGALLITPGLTTDLVGFLAVFPASRNVMKGVIRRYMEKRMPPARML